MFLLIELVITESVLNNWKTCLGLHCHNAIKKTKRINIIFFQKIWICYYCHDPRCLNKFVLNNTEVFDKTLLTISR